MLVRHPVIRAVIAPLHQRPKRLDAVGVRHAVHVFTDRVLDRFMVGEPVVAAMVIGVDHGVRRHLLADKALQRLAVRAVDARGGHPVRLAVLHADDGLLADRTPTLLQLPGLVLVLLFPADVGFVHFYRTRERADFRLERLAEPVQHEPCGLLTDPEVPVQLHGRNALDVGGEQVDAHRPNPVFEVRAFHHRSHLQGEHGATGALPATVGHGLVLDALLDVVRPAVGTCRAVGPALRGDPVAGRVLVAEHVRHFEERDSLPVCLARCLVSHVP